MKANLYAHAQSEPISVKFAGALALNCSFKWRIQLHDRVHHHKKHGRKFYIKQFDKHALQLETPEMNETRLQR